MPKGLAPLHHPYHRRVQPVAAIDVDLGIGGDRLGLAIARGELRGAEPVQTVPETAIEDKRDIGSVAGRLDGGVRRVS